MNKIFVGFVIVLAFSFISCPGTGTETKTYTVTIGTLTNGNIVAVPTSGVEGTEIILTITPSNGYRLKADTLKYGTTAIDQTSKKFNLPAENVTVTAIFEVMDAKIAEAYRVEYGGIGPGSDFNNTFQLTADSAIADETTFNGIYTQGGGDVTGGTYTGTYIYFYNSGTKIGVGFNISDNEYNYLIVLFGKCASIENINSYIVDTLNYSPQLELTDITDSLFDLWASWSEIDPDFNPFIGTWIGTNEGTQDIAGLQFQFFNNNTVIQASSTDILRGDYEYTSTTITIHMTEESHDSGVTWTSHTESPVVMEYSFINNNKISLNNGLRIVVKE
jgi:hypothetical protein